MKIIAHAGGGKRGDYIVQVGVRELAQMLGFNSEFDDSFERLTNGARDSILEAGTELKVTVAPDFWRRVHDHEEKARQSAAVLHALADMITTGLPSALIPPAEPAATPSER